MAVMQSGSKSYDEMSISSLTVLSKIVYNENTIACKKKIASLVPLKDLPPIYLLKHLLHAFSGVDATDYNMTLGQYY